jgi:hypothetical protein
MRSLLAVIAAIYFFYNALSFLPAGVTLVSDGGSSGLDGDAAAVAVAWAARALFAGLALLSLALIEWPAMRRPSAGD